MTQELAYRVALRELNEAAHVVARLARKQFRPEAPKLVAMARETDAMVDGAPIHAA